MVVDLVGILEDGGPPALGLPDDPRRSLRWPRGADVTIRLRAVRRSGAPVEIPALGPDGVVLTMWRRLDEPPVFTQTRQALAGAERGRADFSLVAADYAAVDPSGQGGRFLLAVALLVGDERESLVPLSAAWLEPGGPGA